MYYSAAEGNKSVTEFLFPCLYIYKRTSTNIFLSFLEMKYQCLFQLTLVSPQGSVPNTIVKTSPVYLLEVYMLLDHP